MTPEQQEIQELIKDVKIQYGKVVEPIFAGNGTFGVFIVAKYITEFRLFRYFQGSLIDLKIELLSLPKLED